MGMLKLKLSMLLRDNKITTVWLLGQSQSTCTAVNGTNTNTQIHKYGLVQTQATCTASNGTNTNTQIQFGPNTGNLYCIYNIYIYTYATSYIHT